MKSSSTPTCLEQVGDATDRLAIGECIGNLDVMTPSGRMKFDPETHLAMFGEDLQPLLFYQIWEGERIIIDPERYANGRIPSAPVDGEVATNQARRPPHPEAVRRAR